ncbi:uncharacterized protein LJ264_010368 [Porphyrio hochstetteri]
MAGAASALRRSDRDDGPVNGYGIPALPAEPAERGSSPAESALDRGGSSAGCCATKGEQPPPADPVPAGKGAIRGGVLSPAPAAGWSGADSPIPPSPALGYGYRHPLLTQRRGTSPCSLAQPPGAGCTPLSRTPFAWRPQPGVGGCPEISKTSTAAYAVPLPPPPTRSVLSLPVYGRGRKIPAPTQNAPQPVARSAGGRQQGAPWARRAGPRGAGPRAAALRPWAAPAPRPPRCRPARGASGRAGAWPRCRSLPQLVGRSLAEAWRALSGAASGSPRTWAFSCALFGGGAGAVGSCQRPSFLSEGSRCTPCSDVCVQMLGSNLISADQHLP